MQGKGVVKFFLVLMTLVTLVQYIFIFPTRKVEKNAEKYAQEASQGAPEEQQSAVYRDKYAAYLDSMSGEEVFKLPLLKSYTYQDLKSAQLALGLDLKGGMSVILQVDLKEFIQALANDSKDPTFIEALNKASEAQKNAQSDYVSLFADAWNSIAGDKKLAPIFTRNEALRDQINFGTSDGEVVRIIREKANETVDLTFKLLKERIDKLGVTGPNVSLDASRDVILVELPGISNPERARTFLQAAAKLEFWNVYRVTDAGVSQAFIDANDLLAKTEGGTVEQQTREIMRIDTSYVTDSLGNVDSSNIARLDTIYAPSNLNQGPLFDVFALNTTGQRGLAVLGTAKRNQRARIDTLLNKPEVRNLFPRDLVFRWSKDPIKDLETNLVTDEHELYGIRLERGTDDAPLTGDHVTDASQQLDPTNNQVTVSLAMDNTGTKIWGQMTTKAAQDNNREIAILLDNEVVSAPRVINPITNGNSSITGSYTIQDAKDLANILQIGKLPAETRIIQESLVGPSLGQDNIDRSLRAVGIAFAAVVAFMIFYYGGGGVVSIIALLLNLFFILGSLASLGTVLTLSGIAGIVLTMGMAVDANVIIYERIREELRAGKPLLTSIQDGFRHSYSAIIDANVTTILTSLTLAYFGLGPIKGFAVVLTIGVLSSMFTAVLVGRIILEYWVQGRGKSISVSNKVTENWLTNVNIDWMGKRKWGYAFSGTLLLIVLISFFTRGFELGVDFKGGYSYNVQFSGANVTAQDLREALTPAFEGSTPIVKVVSTENTFNITTSYLINDTEGDAPDRVMRQLYEGVNNVVGGNLDFEQFKDTEGEGTHVTSFSQVSATIADDIQDSSYRSALVALFLIFVYLAVRFHQWKFSLGAVIALAHDVIITIGMFSLFHGVLPFSMELDQAFVAAILTVIGYSVNDTVIVFDRIREFSNIYMGRPKEEVFNLAINNTLSRTLITSGTTLLTVIVLFILGGGAIKGFAFALIVGILFGTYSSVFIASAIVVDLIPGITGTKKVEQKKSFSRAAQKVK